ELVPGTKGPFDSQYSFGELVALGNRVVFVANDGVHGRELWTSDGTEAGTRMLRDFIPGAKGLWDAGFFYSTAFGNRLFFSGYDDAHGWELWSTDGTEAGTALFLDLIPGAESSNPNNFAVSGGKLFFQIAQYGVHAGPAL